MCAVITRSMITWSNSQRCPVPPIAKIYQFVVVTFLCNLKAQIFKEAFLYS